jgi:hypothetical protein
MKILALKIQPIARVFATIYAVFGLLSWIAFRVAGMSYITLPFGIIGPLVHLNFNLTLPRSNNLFYNLLLVLGSIGSFALTGWLTAAVGVFCFNLVAKRRRGISADFVSLRED